MTEIVTAEEVAAILGDSVPANDANVARITASMLASVRRYCGRQFLFAAGQVAYVDGYGRDFTFLPEWPIKTVTEVRVDPTRVFDDTSLVDISNFFFRADDPRLCWRSTAGTMGLHLPFGAWRWGTFPDVKASVKVTFDGGYDPDGDPKPPEDLRGVIIDEILARLSRGTGERMKSESIGSYSYTRFDSGSFAADTVRVLKSYRRW